MPSSTSTPMHPTSASTRWPLRRRNRFLIAALLSGALVVCHIAYLQSEASLAASTAAGSSRRTEQSPPPAVSSATYKNSSSSVRGSSAKPLPSSGSSRSASSGSKTVQVVTHRASDYPNKPLSFFEQRFPQYNLPTWASKPYFFWKSVPKRICLVHVGKAGGSSLGCSLGFQLHCNKEMKYPLGLLPSYTTHLIHNDVTDCPMDMDYYLFSVRDPLERIRSWYVYDKNKLGKLRYDCKFWKLNDLAELGLKRNASQLCIHRAQRAIQGLEKFGNHAYHNYRFYLNQVPSNATVAVIRTEHMLDDWNAMERLLGSKYVVKMLPERNINSYTNPDDKYLSDDSKKLLCAYLCDEIQVYKQLLGMAVNLRSEQVDQSMQELRKTCPIQADMPACPK